MMGLTVEVAVRPLLIAVKLLAVEMGFADKTGSIAVTRKMPGHRERVRLHHILIIIYPYISGVFTGGERCPAGYAERILTVRLIEYGTFRGQAVKSGRVHRGVPAEPQKVRAVLVG